MWWWPGCAMWHGLLGVRDSCWHLETEAEHRGHGVPLVWRCGEDQTRAIFSVTCFVPDRYSLALAHGRLTQVDLIGWCLQGPRDGYDLVPRVKMAAECILVHIIPPGRQQTPLCVRVEDPQQPSAAACVKSRLLLHVEVVAELQQKAASVSKYCPRDRVL
ncbi:hypothetical protein NDU88_008310 [Pleurodeles waltl]|uniref:Uncharacterized protein n=1 Tax=Pleurodeles waltl TaxID=8319 RepID=A0AAV7N6V2_PLEWA|nr:hypothetical protein NDU88_008310 [Pleurodeles waltl]